MMLARVLGTAALSLVASGASIAAEMPPGEVQFENGAVATPLTDSPGAPEEGEKAFVDRSLGNCLACHSVTALQGQQFHGDVAPPLDGVADRWSPEELRAIVADAKQVFGEQSMMPGFYSLNVGINVRQDLVGKTILTAQQVEDIVAYLLTLTDGQ